MITISTYYKNFRDLRKIVSGHHKLFKSPQRKSILVQIFSGTYDKAFLESLRSEILEALPDATIIGTTTMGEIMDGSVSSRQTVVSISVFFATLLIPIRETLSDETYFEVGKAMAEKTKRANSRALILFATLQEQGAIDMLRGITSGNTAIIVAGGCAGSNIPTKNGFVISNAEVSDRCSVVGVALVGENINVRQYWHLCWTPVGKSMTITKATNSTVFSIDNAPAFQIYQKYLGLPDRRSSLLSLIFPVLLKRHGVDIVQAPVMVNDDDSIDFRGKIEQGETIRFSFGHIGMILESIDCLIDDIRKNPADGIFVYSCGWRRAYLQDSAEIETMPLQEIAPTVGFFTNGEFFHAEDTNQLLTGTMTTLALSETVAPDPDFRRRKDFEKKVKAANAAQKGDALSLKGSEIIKTLTGLVESTTAELNEKIAELEEINRKVRFDSMHDGLSGLCNRNFYELEIARIDRMTVSAGILVGDLDGLKLANDTLGHRAGDGMIRAASRILSSFDAENILIFRVGGDEFVVIELDGTRESLCALSDGIQERIRLYNETSPVVTLSISTGLAFGVTAFGKMQELFAEADGNMYENKLRRSKRSKEELSARLIARWKESTFRSAQERSDTQEIAESFARHLKLDEDTTRSIARLAEYHDIGEIGLPPEPFGKRDSLTTKEKTAIERHAEIGFRIAQSSADLVSAADSILKHHEWWDGRGYPLGIKGEHIPVECRMMGVVIAYVALTNERPYRKAFGKAEALAELRTRAGTEFDPGMVESFLLMAERT